MNETEPAIRTRRGATRPLIALLILIVLAYLASPYLSFWFFTRAIKSNDRDAIERYVDFPSVRTSLKQQLHGYLPKPDDRKKNKLSGFFERVAPDLIDQLVDQFVTPEGLFALITDPAVARGLRAKDTSTAMDAERRPHELNFSRVHRAFFTGLRTFAVEVDGRKLVFRFTGIRWRLKRLELSPNE